MTRISLKPKHSPPWYIKLLFYFQKKKYGHVFDPLLLWQRTPQPFLGFLFMQKALNRKKSPLPAALRALVTTKISQINQCAFCMDLNASLLIEQGRPEETIDALHHYKESDLIAEGEMIALEYAEAITLNTVTRLHIEKLKQYFDEDAIVELTALAGLQNLSSKFNAALDAKAFGFCKVSTERS